MYVGTTLGRLLAFDVRDGAGGRMSAGLAAERSLGPKSPVTFVQAASALSRLLVLCDGGLSVLSTDRGGDEGDGAAFLSTVPLAGSSKFRGVTACCLNENPPALPDPFSVQLCLAKRRQVAVTTVTGARVQVERICDLPDAVRAVAMDGACVCAALPDRYVLYDVSAGRSQDLFPLGEGGAPAIARVAREEFLLAAPGGLGMFVTAAGVSERIPLSWSRPADAGFVYHAPHVVTLGQEGIAVYR